MRRNFRWLAIPALFAVVALVNNGCSKNSDTQQETRGSRKYAEDKKGEPIKRGCSRCGVRNRPTNE